MENQYKDFYFCNDKQTGNVQLKSTQRDIDADYLLLFSIKTALFQIAENAII